MHAIAFHLSKQIQLINQTSHSSIKCCSHATRKKSSLSFLNNSNRFTDSQSTYFAAHVQYLAHACAVPSSALQLMVLTAGRAAEGSRVERLMKEQRVWVRELVEQAQG